MSPRVLAVLALAGAIAATLVAVASIDANHEVSQTQTRLAMGRLAVANGELSRQLEQLEPGDSPHQAREAARGAAALSRKLAADVGTAGDLGNLVHNVLAAELGYLDAVGSTLNNPRSPLRSKIMERAIALRQVLQNVPGGMWRAVRGGAALVAYSKARLKAR